MSAAWEQIRRDAQTQIRALEGVDSWSRFSTDLARHCLALLAELEQAEVIVGKKQLALEQAERERDDFRKRLTGMHEAVKGASARAELAFRQRDQAEAQLRELKSILRAWALGDADRMNAEMLGAFLRVFGKATPTLPACRGPKRT